MKIILGDICYPKSEALIIPANTRGSMSSGISAKISKAGMGSIAKESKQYITNNRVEVGDCFSTGPGRLKRRGVDKIYHAVIKRFQSDFTSSFFIRSALHKSLSMVYKDGYKTVTISSIGIEIGELNTKIAAFVMMEQINKFSSHFEIKVIDDNVEFIEELKCLFKE